MKAHLVSFLAGLTFGLGLIVSGMVNPAKILSFLDVTGNWDPSLLVVMICAVLTTAVFYRLAFRREKPMLGNSFDLPPGGKIDSSLLAGAVLFGTGWGLSGFCPGPAITALGLGGLQQVLFLITVLIGTCCGLVIRELLIKQA